MVTLTFIPRLDDESPPATPRKRVTLALARDIGDLQSSLGQLRGLLIVVGAAATLASLGVLAVLVHTGLTPVNRLARKIGLIDEGRLWSRIDPRESPGELCAVVRRLNEMLERLEAAFRREKTMTANVAHELRTPLAGIRSTLEVALSQQRDAATSRQVMSECLRICVQTQRLVECLLTMARMEAGKESLQREPTDVGALLRSTWKSYDELARERALNVQWGMGQDLQIETDAEKLQVVFANVLQNAAQYANAGGTVTIDAARSNGALRVRVANTGCELAQHEVLRVFDPFWRGDASRAATGTHCGLGLPLAKTMIERLGGSIQAESTPDGRFVVAMTV
jgi:signal transduction histidine kinase